ncbi:MAG TPA: class I SAM-dependent methyltransferase [Solirubrobacteraceae bacterium]|nr:class I SAM-dependent methyltransferase [Solirubrobacteraceae bacterium]
MPLPKAIRSRTPTSVRDHPSFRAFALGVGLIPPRSMHTQPEAVLLRQLAHEAGCVVEIGVYEGSSAVVFCEAMSPQAVLHLIDPFSDEAGWALRPGSRATAGATRLAVGRRCRHGGPKLRWHIARSQEVGRTWAGPPVDLVFIDGDHSPDGCREDWDVWHPHVKAGGRVAFHDARLDLPGGTGGPGPTSVVNDLFRAGDPPAGWGILHEVDTMVVVRRGLET